MKENCYRLTVRLQLTQKELDRLSGELEEKDVLIESLRKAAKAGTPVKGGQGRGLEEMENRRRYEIFVQECFYGFALVLYGRVLEILTVETSEQCFK